MRRVQIELERELVMRCAERATAEDMSTAAWITKTLEPAIATAVRMERDATQIAARPKARARAEGIAHNGSEGENATG